MTPLDKQIEELAREHFTALYDVEAACEVAMSAILLLAEQGGEFDWDALDKEWEFQIGSLMLKNENEGKEWKKEVAKRFGKFMWDRAMSVMGAKHAVEEAHWRADCDRDHGQADEKIQTLEAELQSVRKAGLEKSYECENWRNTSNNHELKADVLTARVAELEAELANG